MCSTGPSRQYAGSSVLPDVVLTIERVARIQLEQMIESVRREHVRAVAVVRVQYVSRPLPAASPIMRSVVRSTGLDRSNDRVVEHPVAPLERTACRMEEMSIEVSRSCTDNSVLRRSVHVDPRAARHRCGDLAEERCRRGLHADRLGSEAAHVSLQERIRPEH